jgi:hypothetical protein
MHLSSHPRENEEIGDRLLKINVLTPCIYAKYIFVTILNYIILFSVINSNIPF